MQNINGFKQTMMKSCYPVIMTQKCQECSCFYQKHFGFEEVFNAGWYISLRHPKGQEIAFIEPYHESIPSQFQHIATGFILNIELDNVDEIYENILKEGLNVLAPLETNEYGQRHFFIADPNNILLDIITMI
jgi:uncharacterized glyoxalase superfamily protein PhnB